MTFSYSVVDGKGGVTPAAAVVTVTGSNDAPVITTTATNLKLFEGNAALSASGTLGFSDSDRNATVAASLAGATVTTTGVTLTDTQAAAFKQAYTIADGGQWSFSLASPDYLAQGQTVQVAYQVNVADDKGTTVTQVQTITVTGTNDVPVIGGISTGTVQEDVGLTGNLLTTKGALTIADADAGQSS
ncbi:VCBS domain-containing protein, partial [Neobacillus sp. YIM B02564]